MGVFLCLFLLLSLAQMPLFAVIREDLELLDLLYQQLDLMSSFPNFSTSVLPPRRHPDYHRRLLRVKVCRLLFTQKLVGLRDCLQHIEDVLKKGEKKRRNLQFQSTACTIIGIGSSLPTHGIGPTVAGLYGAVVKTQIADCEATENDLHGLIHRLKDLITNTQKLLNELRDMPPNRDLNVTGVLDGENDL